MPNRSRVRVEPNERIDKPDFEALQLGAHLAVRYLARGLLFGTDVADQTAVSSAWTLVGAGSELTATPGRAIAGEIMADATVELGHIVGEDGDASQVIDFVGQPADLYYIYARSDFSSGVSGSRIFYNASTGLEDAAAIDTREVSGWRVVAATSSPGTAYVQIGVVSWDGGAFTAVSTPSAHLWEGTLGNSGAESSDQWGDGGNERAANRSLYGVQSLSRAIALVRRQLKDIIGVASGHWGSAVPVSLTAAKTHIDTVSDPHGTAPTWSGKPTFNGGIDVNGQVDARGAGYVEVDDKTDIRFALLQSGSLLLSAAGMHLYITNGAPYSYLALADSSNFRMNSTSAATMELLIPLDGVPEGATVTGVTLLGYWENGAGADASIQLDAYSSVSSLFGHIVHLLGSVSEDDASLGITVASFGVVEVSGLSEERTAGKTFFADVSVANSGEAGKLSIVNIRVDYTFVAVVG